MATELCVERLLRDILLFAGREKGKFRDLRQFEGNQECAVCIGLLSTAESLEVSAVCLLFVINPFIINSATAEILNLIV